MRVLAAIAAAVIVAVAAWAVLSLRSDTDDTVLDAEAVAVASMGELVESGDALGFNVLLVTLDTVRADRIGCYGYEAGETPRIDALARRGVLFEDAVTSAPITLPAHATVLTGLNPPGHGVHDNGRYVLADEHVTLAERLGDRGYETAAFVGCFVLDERFGLDQGFELYDFHVSADGHRPTMLDFNERPAEDVTRAALDWLRGRPEESQERPFFAWVHYFDPHLPYRSPYQRLARFADRPYDAEITYTDAELGRLLDELDRQGLTENTLIVLVADHGEAFGEHGEPTHGMLLHEATMHVPFIVSCPALIDGGYRVTDHVVGLVDVMPTIEDLLGMAGRDGGVAVEGISLLARPDDGDRALYIETEMPVSFAGWSPLRGLRTHDHKYVLGPVPEYYDLCEDPDELRNLYDDGGQRLAELEGDLESMLASWERTSATEQRTLSDEEIERLGALGYVQASTRAGERMPDPKEMMPVYNDALRSEQLYGSDRVEEAAALAEEVLEKSPNCALALRVLAFSLTKLDRADDAVAILRESVERIPDAFLVRSLTQLLIMEERYEEALSALELYAELSPGDGRVPMLRGDIRARRGRLDAAIAEYERAIALDEPRVGISARHRIAHVKAQRRRDASD